MEDVPAHGRVVGTRWSLRSLPNQTVLWFYRSVNETPQFNWCPPYFQGQHICLWFTLKGGWGCWVFFLFLCLPWSTNTSHISKMLSNDSFEAQHFSFWLAREESSSPFSTHISHTFWRSATIHIFAAFTTCREVRTLLKLTLRTHVHSQGNTSMHTHTHPSQRGTLTLGPLQNLS